MIVYSPHFIKGPQKEDIVNIINAIVKDQVNKFLILYLYSKNLLLLTLRFVWNSNSDKFFKTSHNFYEYFYFLGASYFFISLFFILFIFYYSF